MSEHQPSQREQELESALRALVYAAQHCRDKEWLLLAEADIKRAIDLIWRKK